MIYKLTLLVTAALTALISGFFYAYVCSVNPGLGRLTDAEYLKAMQSINKAVLNPVFFASFFGSLVLLPVGTWLSYRAGGADAGFYLMLAAAIIYFFGVFLVTGMGNVPLNKVLAGFNIETATVFDLSLQRKEFETPWNKFNMIRAIASTTCLVLVLLTLIKNKFP